MQIVVLKTSKHPKWLTFTVDHDLCTHWHQLWFVSHVLVLVDLKVKGQWFKWAWFRGDGNTGLCFISTGTHSCDINFLFRWYIDNYGLKWTSKCLNLFQWSLAVSLLFNYKSIIMKWVISTTWTYFTNNISSAKMAHSDRIIELIYIDTVNNFP